MSRLRTERAARVSSPCTVFAAPHRALPSCEVGPLDLPPWNRHLVFPRIAGPRHCCRVRFDMAVHWRQVILPAAVVIKSMLALCLGGHMGC